MSAKNNAVILYQRVRYDTSGYSFDGINACEYGPVEVVEFYDDILQVKPDGSYEIGNGLPNQDWVQANKSRLAPRQYDVLRAVLRAIGKWSI